MERDGACDLFRLHRAVTLYVEEMPKPTIVLVHGAWADASSWNAVATDLQGQGFTVLAPPNLLHGVASDAEYIASFLAQRTSGPVVLVGALLRRLRHHERRDRAAVTCARWCTSTRSSPTRARPSSGSSAGPARRSTSPIPTTVFDIVGYPGAPEGDAEAFLKPDTVHAYFAQDLPEADRWLIAAGQRPITLGANTTPSGPAAWKTLPSWAVIGTEDKVIPPDTQRHMAERAGATITEVAASHVSMVSHPQAAIDAILTAVAAVGD